MAKPSAKLPAAVLRRTVLAAAAIGCSTRARAAEPILVGGTGSALGLARGLAADHATRTGQAYRILPSLGSSGGLRALAAGRIDIALTLTPPDTEGGALRTVMLGRTPIALATHPATAGASIGAEQAARMLTAQDRSWPDGTPVRLVLRPPMEHEWHALRAGPPGLARGADGPSRRLGAVTATTAQDNAQALRGIEGSLGVISIGQVFAEAIDLRIVVIDGLAPSVAALRAGSWTCAIVLHATIRADARAEVTEALRHMTAQEGAAIAAGLGYDPAAAA